jgi:ribosomal protein S18 acetylase RimI-like enzyme
MNKINIRGLKKEEIPKLIILMKDVIPNIEYYPRKNLNVFLRTYTKEHLSELYDHDDSIFLVAEENEKESHFVGFLFGWNEYGVFWIDWLGVEEHKRRNHIATNLIRECERRARRMKCHKMFLDTSCINIPAIHLYKKCNYKIEAQLKNHWLKWNYDLIGKVL